MGSSPNWVNTKTIKKFICGFFDKHAELSRKKKTEWLRIRIMCPSGATCPSADCCCSELVELVLNNNHPLTHSAIFDNITDSYIADAL